ncbi:MAG: DeoR/GlpR family DNA-binding transcription regulator [Microbacteriaceae bacterium]|nr:DeoR/GlpR family DNA-binding transcription regulator [Microbacteriaceae bacterium]
MSVQGRRALIEQRVLDEGEIDFTSLATELGVSEMTIRRDVEALEVKGVLRRVMGGAISVGSAAAEPSFEARAALAATEKAHIASAVVDLLHEGETVIIDSGSSALAVAREIRSRHLPLTVITPSLLVATELSTETDTEVYVTGGQLRPGELSLIGAGAQASFEIFNATTFVMGVAGVADGAGVTDYHHDEAHVKRAAARSAQRIIVVADSSKLGQVQLISIAKLADLDTLVTDGPPEHPAVRSAREAGVTVICVQPPGAMMRGHLA